MVKGRLEALTPIEKKRRRIYIWLFLGVIVIGVIFRFLLISTVRSLNTKTNEEYIDFYEMNWDSIEDGTNVELNVEGILKYYAYDTHSSTFIKSRLDKYYVVWLDGGEVISISVNDEKTAKKLDELYDYTWDYIEHGGEWNPPHSISIKGKISKLSEIMANVFYTHLDALGYSEAHGTIFPYNIDGTSESRFKIYATIFFGLAEIVLLAAIFIIFRKNSKAEEKERKEALKAAIYDNEAECNENYDNANDENYDSSIISDTFKYLNRK